MINHEKGNVINHMVSRRSHLIPEDQRIQHPASLRRIDWRFLLPTPPDGAYEHLILIGGPANLRDRILETGLARRVTSTLQDEPADAVIVLHDASAVLNAAAYSVKAGGVLYVEVDRRSLATLTMTPTRLRSILKRSGLAPIGLYWAKPDFDNSEMYLPLDVQATLKWYQTTLFAPVTPLRRLLEVILWLTTGFNSRRFASLAPCYAVVAVAGPEQGSGTLPDVLCASRLPADIQQPDVYPLVLADKGNRAAILPFARDGSQPLAVLKVPKLTDFNWKTENEQSTLITIRSWLGQSVVNTLPQPLGTIQHNGITIGVESYLSGHSMIRSSGRWGSPQRQKLNDLRDAASWLAEFHRQSESSRPFWSAAELDQWVEQPFNAYREAFGTMSGEEHLFRTVHRHAQSLQGLPFPMIWQHRDFNVWNIFRAEHKLAVIDWEGGQLGPALCDLLHFAKHWNDTVRHLSKDEVQLESFRTVFLANESQDTVTKAIHQAIENYRLRLEFDRRFLPLLLVYTWVELALRRVAQQRTMSEVRADPRSGNLYVRYVTLIAEHAKQFF